MPGKDPKPGVSGSALRLIAISFEVSENEIRKSPARLKKLLGSKQFQKKIEDILKKESRKLVQDAQQQALDGNLNLPDQATGQNLLNKAQKEFIKSVTSDLKKSSGAKQLNNAYSDLEDAFNKSQTGIWIDRNKGKVYVVGAIGLIGGVLAVYKSGNDTLGRAVELIDKEIKLGPVKLEIGVTDFRPGSGKYGGKFRLRHSLKKFSYDLKVIGKVSADSNQLAADGIVKINKEFKIYTKAKWASSNKSEITTRKIAGFETSSETRRTQVTLDLAVGVKIESDKLTLDLVGYTKNITDSSPGQSGFNAGASIKAGVPFNARGRVKGMFTAEGKAETGPQMQTGVSGMLGLGLTFP